MDNKIIGRVLATEKAPTTIDKFAFWTEPNLILNPFDIVKVEHVNNTYTYGVIEDIAHITDATSFLTNYISSDFGDVEVESPTLRIGMNYVQAKVICNKKNIYIPLQSNAKVYLATADEIEIALGLANISNPLVCGYLEMYDNTEGGEKVVLPVKLNSKFLIGPEGAHLNISGISGLAAKTSYSMFLMKSIQDNYLYYPKEDDSVAFVMFNVKGCDLLAIDEMSDFSDTDNPGETKANTISEYEMLKLKPEPFKNVHYYYPFSDGLSANANTYLKEESFKEQLTLKKAKKYKYIYKYDKDNLDLLLADIDDSTQTMDAIISLITEPSGEFAKAGTWDAFLAKVKEKMQSGQQTGKDIPVQSWRKFYRNINKIINSKNTMFTNDYRPEKRETRLAEDLKYIKKNEVHVIDIAKLSEQNQAFVFGDVIRTIYNLQLGEYNDDQNTNPPARIVIFIDELNKYASKEVPKNSPILKQILDVAERGRSLGVVLFGAEQFRTAIHDRVIGNCATHAYGRTNAIEVGKSDYKYIPSVFKNMMTRLEPGEYIIQNPLLRSLLKIRFPRPIYKQYK